MKSIVYGFSKWTNFRRRFISSFALAKQQFPIPVLHRCDDYLVINKPYGLPVYTKHGGKLNVTLSDLLSIQFPELVDHTAYYRFRFGHRLDHGTSGCLMIALNPTAAQRIFHIFNPDNLAALGKPLPFIRKYYLALVKGYLAKPYLHGGVLKMDAWVGQDLRTPTAVKMKKMLALYKQELFNESTDDHSSCGNPKSALSKILVLEHGRYSYEDKKKKRIDIPATKILVRTLTGRRHQIRLHCSKLGHPVIGDFMYGCDSEEDYADYSKYVEHYEIIPRMYLHAWRLRFTVHEWEGRKLVDAIADDPFMPEGTKGRWMPDKILTPFDEQVLSILE